MLIGASPSQANVGSGGKSLGLTYTYEIPARSRDFSIDYVT
jgi:hypothetical protein